MGELRASLVPRAALKTIEWWPLCSELKYCPPAPASGDEPPSVEGVQGNGDCGSRWEMGGERKSKGSAGVAILLFMEGLTGLVRGGSGRRRWVSLLVAEL